MNLGDHVKIVRVSESKHFGYLDSNLLNAEGRIIKTVKNTPAEEYGTVLLTRPVTSSIDPTLLLQTVTVYPDEIEVI